MAKRTSTLPLAGTWTTFFDSEVTVTPSALSATVTSPSGRFLVEMITPASMLSPVRKKRGNAGRAMSGRLVTTCASPKPKRSSSAAATAMSL